MAKATWQPRGPQPNAIRRCTACGSHFRGAAWKQLCPTCWRWRMALWHLAAASRALRDMP